MTEGRKREFYSPPLSRKAGDNNDTDLKIISVMVADQSLVIVLKGDPLSIIPMKFSENWSNKCRNK